MKIVKNRIRFVGASIGTASAIGLGTLALAGGSAVAVGATSVAAPERASVDRLFTRAISAGQAAPAFADVARGGSPRVP